MTTERSCAADGIELCLDAGSVQQSLRGLLVGRRMEPAAIRRSIDAAQKKWGDVKARLKSLEGCDLTLVDDRLVQDIDANLRNLDPESDFLREDGPFIAQQVSRLLRFEVLTSAGRASRS